MPAATWSATSTSKWTTQIIRAVITPATISAITQDIPSRAEPRPPAPRDFATHRGRTGTRRRRTPTNRMSCGEHARRLASARNRRLYCETTRSSINPTGLYGTARISSPSRRRPAATSNDPTLAHPAGPVYLQDITRGYTQKAAFTSVDFDVIPKTLTVTAGTRYYDISDFEKGSNVGSFGCEIYGPYDGGVPPSPCTVPTSNGNNLNALNLNKTYVGSRAAATSPGMSPPTRSSTTPGRRDSGPAGSTSARASSRQAHRSTEFIRLRSSTDRTR